jgi:hypothetical protein
VIIGAEAPISLLPGNNQVGFVIFAGIDDSFRCICARGRTY